MGAPSQGHRNGRARLRPPKSYFLTIIHMIRGNGATPQGARILASIATLAVATVCVVLLCTENTGDMKEEAAPISSQADTSGKPELKMVQMPMILASDADLRRAIAAREHKDEKAKEIRHKKAQQSREAHQQAQKARRQQHLSTQGMSASMKRMVARRNHAYNLEKRKKAMARALMNDDDESENMELIQAFDFTPANAIDKAMGGLHARHSHLFSHLQMHRSAHHHSNKNSDADASAGLMQIGATVKLQNFADDITKELHDFTSSSHAVASDLLYGDEENAAKAKKKMDKDLKPPKKKKKKITITVTKHGAQAKKSHRRHSHDDEEEADSPFDRNGPLAKYMAFQQARFAMKNALGNANKNARQSTLTDDDNLQLFQLPEDPELYQTEALETAQRRLHKAQEQQHAAETHAARASKRHAARIAHALELIEVPPTANEKAAAALKKKMNAMMAHQKAAMKRQNQQAQKAMRRNAAAAKKAMQHSVKEVHQKTRKISKDAKHNKMMWAKKAKQAKRKARKAAKKAARKVKKAKQAARKLVKKAKAKAKLKEEMMLLSIDTDEEEPHEKASSLLAAAAKAATVRKQRMSEVELIQGEFGL